MPAPATESSLRKKIEEVREIGLAYREEFPYKTEIHTNQNIAGKLVLLLDTASEVEVQTAVMIAWSELQVKHGNLATALKQFYFKHYNSVIPEVFARPYTLEDIQQIGKDYLARYPTTTFVHSNQDLAKKIAEYNPDGILSTDTVEHFLMMQYFDLPKPEGKLARSIEHFMKTYLGRNLPQGQIADVTVEGIQKIGLEYLCRNSGLSIGHNNHSIASEIANYNPTPLSNEAAKKFLITKFYDLPYFHGELASAIKKYYVTHFGAHLNSNLLILYFPVSQITALGEKYLKEHPDPSAWFVFMGGHSNQAQARQLLNIETLVEDAEPDKRQMTLWIKLIEIYSSLPNPDGGIALAIETLVKKVFCVPGPEKVLAQGGNAMPKTMTQIGHDLYLSIKDQLEQAFNLHRAPVFSRVLVA